MPAGAGGSGLRAAIANFDSMSPQVTGPSFVDGGIRFFDSDNRIDATTPFFVIKPSGSGWCSSVLGCGAR